MKMYSAKDYLYIHIANLMGKDKDLFEDRIDWVAANDANLESMWEEADEPYQFRKMVRVLRDAQNHKPVHAMCALDAVNSGTQIMSALMGCRAGAEATGLIDTGERPDAYSKLQGTMEKLLDIQMPSLRQDLKDAFMCYLYGSQEEPARVFGVDEKLNAFHKAMELIAPGAVELRNTLVNAWIPYQMEFKATAPDGFDMVIKSMVKRSVKYFVPQNQDMPFILHFEAHQGRYKCVSLAANVIHMLDGYIVREMIRRCSYNLRTIQEAYAYLVRRTDGAQATNTKQCISLRLVDYLYQITDMNTLCRLRDLCADVLRWESGPLVAIHDSFKAPFGHMNKVRYWYKELLAEFAESEVLEDILEELVGTRPTIDRACPNLADLIRKAQYPLS